MKRNSFIKSLVALPFLSRIKLPDPPPPSAIHDPDIILWDVYGRPSVYHKDNNIVIEYAEDGIIPMLQFYRYVTERFEYEHLVDLDNMLIENPFSRLTDHLFILNEGWKLRGYRCLDGGTVIEQETKDVYSAYDSRGFINRHEKLVEEVLKKIP